MIDATEKILWDQFNLAENNPDPGGGILYAIRYDTEELLAHRDAVISACDEAGASIREINDTLVGVTLFDVAEEDQDRVVILLEELSVVSEAIEYHEAGINPADLSDLADELKASFRCEITSSRIESKIYALNLVDLGIPTLVDDLEVAQSQNDVLTLEDQRIIRGLGSFASMNAELFGSHRVVILGSSFSN
jgi:hypothetical protein